MVRFKPVIHVHFQLLWLFILFFLCARSSGVTAQEGRFGMGLVLGLNASQIDGDNSFGYNKLGLTGGLKGRIFLRDPLELQTGILYSRQGSRSVFLSRNPWDLHIDLHYVQVPLEVHFKDWLQEKGYHAFHYFAGLNYGRLVYLSVRDGGFGVPDSGYTQNDISWFLGAQYQISKPLGIALRYTRSFNLLYDRDRVAGSQYRSMLGYFLSLQLVYHL
jgi:hypothetical protein